MSRGEHALSACHGPTCTACTRASPIPTINNTVPLCRPNRPSCRRVGRLGRVLQVLTQGCYSEDLPPTDQIGMYSTMSRLSDFARSRTSLLTTPQPRLRQPPPHDRTILYSPIHIVRGITNTSHHRSTRCGRTVIEREIDSPSPQHIHDTDVLCGVKGQANGTSKGSRTFGHWDNNQSSRDGCISFPL